MGVKVATNYLHWSQQTIPHSPSQAIASGISSPSSKKHSISVKGLDRSSLFGTPATKIYRSRSCEHFAKSRIQTLKRACSDSLENSFSDEEFSKQMQELALRFQLSALDDDKNSIDTKIKSNEESTNSSINYIENEKFTSSKLDPVEPPDWAHETIPASIERKANSVDLRLSLMIIKRKKQWQEGFREAGESAYCSVNKAFSSMVFIIRELQSYTLKMREVLFYEDLQGILVRVQKEMNASFVWLFQQVFSRTPTLMVYVMILLANYSVYSMESYNAMAVTPPPQAYAATTESVSVIEDQKMKKFDSSTIKMFSVSSLSGKTVSIGGSGHGGGKFRHVASGTDGGDGRSDGPVSLEYNPTVIGTSGISEEESISGQVSREEEIKLWNSIVEEASKMEGALRDEGLDHKTMQIFISPISVKIEADDYEDYFRTELMYQMGLVQEPNNALLLANYAQFLYLVVQDYDRAEDYFKRAAKVEPKDAEALNKYASFLWQVRKDLWAAEETYLEAISADPSNSYYASNYAHFLWNTGGEEDTCFPLTSPDTTTNDA